MYIYIYTRGTHSDKYFFGGPIFILRSIRYTHTHTLTHEVKGMDRRERGARYVSRDVHIGAGTDGSSRGGYVDHARTESMDSMALVSPCFRNPSIYFGFRVLALALTVSSSRIDRGNSIKFDFAIEDSRYRRVPGVSS